MENYFPDPCGEIHGNPAFTVEEEDTIAGWLTGEIPAPVEGEDMDCVDYAIYVIAISGIDLSPAFSTNHPEAYEILLDRMYSDGLITIE